MAARIGFQAFVWLQYIVYAARLNTPAGLSVCLSPHLPSSECEIVTGAWMQSELPTHIKAHSKFKKSSLKRLCMAKSDKTK